MQTTSTRTCLDVPQASCQDLEERSARCEPFSGTSLRLHAPPRHPLGLIGSSHSNLHFFASSAKMSVNITGGNVLRLGARPMDAASAVNSSVVASVAAQVPKASAAAPLLVKIVQNLERDPTN